MICLVRHFFVSLLLCLLVLPATGAGRDINDGVRYLHVQKGQTLHSIVRRLYPERVEEWPALRAEIVRRNPAAFIYGDERKILAGSRIVLPGKRQLPTVVKPPPRKAVGYVTQASGQVIAVDTRNIRRPLVVDAPVYIGDKLITGDDGQLSLQMIDRARLELRCFSIMVIEQYALKAGSRRSILNLLKGTLKKITGEIGKLAGDWYELKTPLASIGVRGTEYALRVFQSKGCQGAADTGNGLYLQVARGQVDVSNQTGVMALDTGDSAYVADVDSKPVKQPLRPGVFDAMPAEEAERPALPGGWFWWLMGGIGLLILL